MAFDQQALSQFKEKLLIMASHAESVVTRAVRAHLDRDEPLAQQALETDEIIDQFEIQIDRIALDLLSQNPGELGLKAHHLRHEDQRRIWNRSGMKPPTIASRSIELMALPTLDTPLDIAEMTFLVNAMLKDALDSFVVGNTVLARGVIPRDRQVDELNNKYQRQLTELMEAESITSAAAFASASSPNASSGSAITPKTSPRMRCCSTRVPTFGTRTRYTSNHAQKRNPNPCCR